MLFDFPLKPAHPDEVNLFYSDPSQSSARIGHMRANFGDGNEFWFTWFPDEADEFNTPVFRAELQALVECLRADLLSSRDGMHRYLCEHHGLLLEDSYVRVIGYRMKTEKYSYYIRCAPSRGNYDCYIYCYANQEHSNA